MVEQNDKILWKLNSLTFLKNKDVLIPFHNSFAARKYYYLLSAEQNCCGLKSNSFFESRELIKFQEAVVLRETFLKSFTQKYNLMSPKKLLKSQA